MWKKLALAVAVGAAVYLAFSFSSVKQTSEGLFSQIAKEANADIWIHSVSVPIHAAISDATGKAIVSRGASGEKTIVRFSISHASGMIYVEIDGPDMFRLATL